MVHSDTICPVVAMYVHIMATFDAAQVILVNFEELILNWLRMSFDAKVWQLLLRPL